MRELNGDIYFGAPRGVRSAPDGLFDGAKEGFDTMRYSEPEVRRIAHVAFQAAQKRQKKLTSVDKANVLETSQLWRDVMIDVSKEYADVELSHMYVDNAAMQLVKAPKAFDVVVTGNMFGDILSDEAAMLTGSIGMLPSASLDKNNKGLYEPSHGSAPDIAGKGVANPLATILSAAMMLRYSLGKTEQADRIESAVKKVLEQGYRTGDIATHGRQDRRHEGNGRRGARGAVNAGRRDRRFVKPKRGSREIVSFRRLSRTIRANFMMRGAGAAKTSGYRVYSFVMAKISQISLDLDLTRRNGPRDSSSPSITRIGTSSTSKRITKISHKTITIR